MKKKIMINFAKPIVPLKVYSATFVRAVQWANYNLFTRHRIKITKIKPLTNGWIQITIDIPDDVKFSNRYLRGLSKYFLCSEDAEIYKRYRRGLRLFDYVEMEG